MSSTITLKLKNNDGGIDKVNHEIEEIDLFQFQQTMKVVNDVFTQLDKDSALKSLFKEMFSPSLVVNREKYEALKLDELKAAADKVEIEYESAAKKEELIDLLTEYDNQLIQEAETQKVVENLMGSFQTLMVELPEQAFRLLSILSGIEFDKLKQQKLMAVMDIYDAIIEENEIEELVNRAKKSLALTKAKVTFQNFGKKIAAGINRA